MAIKNSVSNNLRSTFVDCINIFYCRLSEVFIEYRPTEYVAKQSKTRATKSNLQSGNKRQSKTLFLTILDLLAPIVLTF